MTDNAMRDFLTTADEATKAKYAAELENASEAWRKPLDFRYAESLVHFGLLERLVKPLVRAGRVRGSRAWFRKAAECTPRVSISAQVQTREAA